MNRKIGSDAFPYYVSLGTDRSYEAVAKKYGVTKRAVTDLAAKENWQKRLSKIEREAQEKTDKRVAETLEQMNDRHIKVLKFIQNRSIEALKTMPLESAMEAVRAYTLSLDKERVIRGEPSERGALSIADMIKRDFEELMVVDDGEDEETDPAVEEGAVS